MTTWALFGEDFYNGVAFGRCNILKIIHVDSRNTSFRELYLIGFQMRLNLTILATFNKALYVLYLALIRRFIFEWEDIVLDFLEFGDLLIIQITHPVNSLGSTLKNLREVQVSDSNFRIHKIDFIRQEPKNLLAIFDVC